MKKQLAALTLSLIASQGLFADYDARPASQTTNSNGHPSDCCRPCCAPNPRNAANCECYVPGWYDMQCDWGLFLTVDFLYWYGRECNLPYAKKVTVANGFVDANDVIGSTVAYPTSYQFLNTAWDPGVRVGLGWNMNDSWDLYFKWTGYWNRKSGSSSVTEFGTNLPVAGASAFQPIWQIPQNMPIPGGAFAVAPLYSKVSGKWRFDMNRFDLEMGRRYWLSRCFLMRPFIGLGGIWTKTNYNVSYRERTVQTDVVTDSYTISGSDKFRNNNWGVGFVGGFEPTFQFSDCWALYGNVGMALLWGRQKHRGSHVYNQEFVSTASAPTDTWGLSTNFTERDNEYCMLPILDLGIGLRWETFWCDNQYHFAFDLGWEHHTLFDHNMRRTGAAAMRTGVMDNFDEFVVQGDTFFSNNVNLGGLVVRVRFDF